MSQLALSFTAPRIEEDQLEKEMSELSYSERNQIGNDLCGVSHTNSLINESCENTLRHMMQQLDNELNNIPVEHKNEYLEAQIRCNFYVNSDSFRLMFLRCENYCVKKASTRIVQHWKDKVNIFGRDIAYKGRITMNDISPSSGCEDFSMSVLPLHDKAGRAILYSSVNHQTLPTKRPTNESTIKQFWVMLHNAIEDDVSIQHNGMVLLSHIRCNTQYPLLQNRKVDNKICRLIRESVPVKIMGIHQIFSTGSIHDGSMMNSYVNHTESIKVMSSVYLHSLGAELRKRYRKHVGRGCFNLDKYGITANILPQELGGTLLPAAVAASSTSHANTPLSHDKQTENGNNDKNDNNHHGEFCDKKMPAVIEDDDVKIILKPSGGSMSNKAGKKRKACVTEEFLLKERECFSRSSSRTNPSRSPSPSLSLSSHSSDDFKQQHKPPKLVSVDTDNSLGLLAGFAKRVTTHHGTDTKNWQPPDDACPSPTTAAKRQRSSPCSSPIYNNIMYTTPSLHRPTSPLPSIPSNNDQQQ